MPRYTYTCTGCGWEGTRIARFEERDLLTCERQIFQTELEAGADIMPTASRVCGAPLKRAEIETTAFTPYGWRAD